MIRIFHTSAWRKLRVRQLKAEPWCRLCRQVGRQRKACTADHIRPHRGNLALAFDAGNLQSLCASCRAVDRTDEGA